MPRARNWEEMRVQVQAQLERQTGRNLESWMASVREAAPATEDELRAWLAARGVEGYPRDLLVRETFGYPDYLVASADELIDGQYADRPGLRPILDAILELAPTLGDVSVQARKGYVTLVAPRRTFASIEPTTKTRVDLGLRLAGVDPTGRAQAARNMGQSGVNLRIALASAGEVDDEVAGWLRRAYDANR